MNKDIPDFNDRCRLVLLERKVKKTFWDKREIKKLKYRYSNFEVYEKDIEVILNNNMRYLDFKETIPSYYNERTGEYVSHEDNVQYFETNESGLKALRSGYFPSDYWDKVSRTKWARVAMILGVIGGLVSLTRFLVDLFKV